MPKENDNRYDDQDDDDRDEERSRRRRRRRDENDESDEDATGGVIPYKNPKALAAYYVSIFGIFLPVIGSVIAVILGILGLSYAKQKPKARGQVHASIGIGCGLLGVILWIGFIVLFIIGMNAR